MTLTNIIPYIDPTQYPGNDLGAQINYVDQLLGSSAGTITVPPGDYQITTQVVLSSNRTLFLGAGNYYCNTPKESFLYRDNTTIEGDGYNTVIYESSTSITTTTSIAYLVFSPFNNSYSSPNPLAPGGTNVVFRNFRIAKAAPFFATAGQSTLNLGNSSHVIVENIHFDHTSAIGLQLGASSRGTSGYVQGAGGTFTGLNGTQIKVSVDGFAVNTITFNATCIDAASTAAYLATRIPGATATVVGGQVKISSFSVSASSTINIVLANPAAGFAVAGLGVPGTGGYHAQWITVKNCTFDGPASFSIAGVNVVDFRIMDNNFLISAHNGAMDFEVNTATDDIRNFVISGNVIDMRKGGGAGGIGLAAGGARCGPGVISNNTFIGEDIYSLSFNYGVAYTAIGIINFQDVLVTGNNMQGHWDQIGLYVYNSVRVDIIANRIQASGAATTGNAPAIRLGSTRYCTVMSNSLYAPANEGNGSAGIIEYNLGGNYPNADYNYIANNYQQQNTENYTNSPAFVPPIQTVGAHTRSVGNSQGMLSTGPAAITVNTTGAVPPSARTVFVQAAQNVISLTMPNPATLPPGTVILFKNSDGGTANHPFTLLPFAGETFNGQANVVSALAPYAELEVRTDGTNWLY